MGRFGEQQVQLKVVFPAHLYAALREEAQAAAVTMADLVRLAVKERYEDRIAKMQEPIQEAMDGSAMAG